MNNWRKGIIQWRVGDSFYISVPFTWLMTEAEAMANDIKENHKKANVMIGGPALMTPNQCEGFDPILFHNPCATFTTRGCINNCLWCAVPKLEGDLREIPDFRPAPMICDNNFLAASKKHIRNVIDSLKQYSFVDFNQGLQASRLTPEYADWLGELNCKVRFGFDSWDQERFIKKAINLCARRSTKYISVYVLIGFDDTPDDARAKLENIRSWGIRPYPMRYQPLDAEKKNNFVSPGWTEYELLKMVHYYSRLRWYEHIPYEDYEYKDNSDNQLTMEGLLG